MWNPYGDLLSKPVAVEITTQITIHICSNDANGSWFMDGLWLGSVQKEEGVLNPNSFEHCPVSIDRFKLILAPENARNKNIPQFMVSTALLVN